MSEHPVFQVGDRAKIHGSFAEIFELIERELADPRLPFRFQSSPALSQHTKDEFALSFATLLQAFLPAFFNSFFHPTGCQFHNLCLFCVVEQLSPFLVKKQLLLVIEPQISINESRNQPHPRRIEPKGHQQPQALEFDARPLLRSHAHPGHKRTGDWVCLPHKIPPLEPAKLNDAVAEAEDIEIGNCYAVLVWFRLQ